MNEFVKPNVSYAGIIDALLEVSRDRINGWGASSEQRCDPWYVQDARTIGFMVGRQCGASEGVLRWMARHPNKCILITKDSRLKLALANRYLKITGRGKVDYSQLVPHATNTIEEWNVRLTDDEKANTRYIIVDDAQFTIGMGNVKRAEFNKWIAETFHPDTFVILIK